VTGPAGIITATKMIYCGVNPPSHGITIDNGAASTTSPNVGLSIAAQHSGLDIYYVSFANEDKVWSPWQFHSQPFKPWTLSAGDGPKTVYARFQTRLLNPIPIPGITSATILLDSQPPRGSIAINYGAAATSSPNVTLVLNATDVGSGINQMRLANLSTPFPSAATLWGPWMAFDNTQSWQLTEGDGLKYVAVQFKDVIGHVYQYVDSIQLNSGAPLSCFMFLNKGAACTDSQSVAVIITHTLPVTMTKMRRVDSAGNPLTTWLPYASRFTVTLPGSSDREQSLSYELSDSLSRTYMATDSIILDRTPPTDGILIAKGDDRKVSLQWSGFTDYMPAPLAFLCRAPTP
jgi:hypothetical protein